MEGSGASAGLVLIRKPRSASGYYGVGKNGKKWQARVYKAAKQQWDAVGNFESPREAAIVAAIAQKQTAAGFGYLYSPLKKRTKKGALPTTQHMRLLHTAHHAAPRAARASEGPQTQTATQRGRLWCGRGWTPARLPLACCTPPACAACPPTVRRHLTTSAVLSTAGKAAIAISSDELDPFTPVLGPISVNKPLTSQLVTAVAVARKSATDLHVDCVCTRTCVVGRMCLCGRVPEAPVRAPVPKAVVGLQWMSPASL